SILIIWFGEPVNPSANASTTKVLPTPVGPRNSNDAIGRRGSDNPLMNFSRQAVIAATASSCPTIREANLSRSSCTFGLTFVVSMIRIGRPLFISNFLSFLLSQLTPLRMYHRRQHVLLHKVLGYSEPAIYLFA